MTCQTDCRPGPDPQVPGEADLLAGLVGDFDAASKTESDAWHYRAWQRIAADCGFEQELHDAALAARRSRVGLEGLHAAAVAAFAHRTRTGAHRPDRARTQLAVLQALAAQAETGSRWRVEADAATLPAGACIDADPNPEGLRARAFHADGAPGYFADALAGPAPTRRSACGWRYPVALNLGTFPWVYGSRLDAEPPALAWDAAADAAPAAFALQLATSLWLPPANLREDAHRIAAQWQHFRRHTAPMVDALPLWDDTASPRAGVLHRRGVLLHAPHASLAAHQLIGPRGAVAANAYNAIVLRFATFFTARRAFLRLSPSIR